MSGWPWSHLDLTETNDKTAIRRAYASKLKQLDVDQDIAGYAQLRDARDYALFLANTAERGDVADGGLLDDDADGGFAEVQFGAADAEGTVADDLDDNFWDVDADPDLDQAFCRGVDVRWAAPEPDTTAEIDEPSRRAWLGLQSLIFPDDEYSEAPFTAEEHTQAMEHLAVLLDRAEHSDIAEHDALDHALADMLAQGWPRSAPLAMRAGEAFRWSDEAGHIGERPALQFLNARMAELRFREEVQQEGHPLHKAWVELTTPGRAGVFKRFRIRKGAVIELLTLVRTQYPGLEELFDTDRVASWDGPIPTWRAWFARLLFFAFVVLQIMGVIAMFSSDTKKDDAPLPMYTPDVGTVMEYGVQYEFIARALFGGEMTMEEVTRQDPLFAERLKTQIRTAHADRAMEGAREMLRQDMLRARESADDKAVIAISRIYLGWLKAQNAGGNDTCWKSKAWQFGEIDMDADALRAEQKLAVSLLQEELLGKAVPVAVTRERTVNISEAVSARALKISGLSRERFNAATENPDDPDRCRMTIGMLEAAIDAPGKTPVELLRIL